MPLYEHRCPTCNETVTTLQRYGDPPPTCCDVPMTKLVSRGAFILKGGGWYSDGYQSGKPTENKNNN